MPLSYVRYTIIEEDITLEKKDFAQHVRYTVTLKDENGKLRPANFYAMRLHEDGMVVRFTEKAGALRKIAYADVIKIVHKEDVTPQYRYYVPDAVLHENNWKDRKELAHYSSMPHAGK